MKVLSLAAIVFTCMTGAAAVAGPVGEWRIADGSARVAIRPCGGNLCGFVSWSQDAESTVGQQVLVSMKASGDKWSGTVVNVRDGQKYAARMSLLSEAVLKVEGCVMGGMVCGGQQWSRVK